MQPDPRWLDSDEGHAWLQTDEGNTWFAGTEEGVAWSRSEAGHRYFDALTQQGWERTFSEGVREAPEGWITPENAPRIGSRVRFAATETTIGGSRFEEGELGFVEKLVYTPSGLVQVHLRTLDGRTQLTFQTATFTSA